LRLIFESKKIVADYFKNLKADACNQMVFNKKRFLKKQIEKN